MASSTRWFVSSEPIGDNAEQSSTDKNLGGMVVFITDGTKEGKKEVARVAWVRRNAKNSRVNFADQLQKVLDTAKEGAEKANELDDKRLETATDAMAPIRETLTKELEEAQKLRSDIETLAPSELATAARVAEALKTFDTASAKRVEDAVPDLKDRMQMAVDEAKAALEEYDKGVNEQLKEFLEDSGELL